MSDLHAAYARYLEVTEHIHRTSAWHDYGDLFTRDAVYRRVGMPDRVGRDAIRAQLAQDATSLPGSLVERTEVHWRAVDTERARVVQELRHVACDPGDGSVHEALATSMLTYAGDGLWSSLTVVHSPEAYRSMYRSWARCAEACGRSAEAAQVLRIVDARATAHQDAAPGGSSSTSWPTEASSSRTTR